MIIRSIPYERDVQNKPVAVNLQPSLFQQTEKTQSALIEEAISFYNYGIPAKRGIIYKNPGRWKPITKERLINAICLLRDQYNSSLKYAINGVSHKKELIRHLPNSLIRDLTPNDKENKYNTISDNANRGIFAVRSFLDTNWRSTNLNYKGKRNRARCRMLEKAIPRLDDIRWAGGIKNVTEMLHEQYGDMDNALSPIWGGTKIIGPDWTKKPARYYAKSGDWHRNLYGSGTDICLAEKLYICLASEAFKSAHRLWGSTYTGHKGEGCGLLEIIEYKINSFQNEVLPFGAMDIQHIWKTWFSNLDLLAYRFGHAIRQNTELASQVGLPWALALIGVLKTYLLDIMARTLILSLPVKQVYDDVSGNAGICLLEALEAHSARGPDLEGCLDIKQPFVPQNETGPKQKQVKYYEPRLSGVLRKWPQYPAVDPWHGNSELQQTITHLFKDLAATPLLVNFSVKTRHGRKPGKGISVADFKKSIYRFPIIDWPFFTQFGLRQSKQNDINFGIRYLVQAHLYAACIIVKEARDIVGVTQLDWRGGQGFTLGDGCFPWGGKCPPHKTHKDGRRIDLNYGPHIVPWPFVKIEEEMEWFNTFFKVSKENRKKHKTLLSVCYTNNEVAAAEKAISPQNLVFRETLTELIYQTINGLRYYARKNPLGYNTKEAEKYRNAEKTLIGTPHFYHIPDKLPKEKRYKTRTIQDWKMAHIGHTAILLSAPHLIIFASPITHLRAMHSVRKALSQYVDLSPIGAKIVGQAFFAFLPQDHHHHWHVEYLNPRQKDNIGTTIKDFQVYTKLWLAMGIDFGPFLSYLEKKRSPTEEFQKLFEVLTQYDTEFRSIYYYNNKKDNAALEPAKNLLKDIFLPYKDETSPFLKPTITKKGGRYAQSKEVRDKITYSVRYVENIMRFYFLNKKIEKITLKSFSYDNLNIPTEYYDVWGLENAEELTEEADNSE